MYKYFFIVGAQRSGTTFLYTLLDKHPQIQMARPVRPEPKFFLKEEEYSLGIDFYNKTYYTEIKEGALWLGEKSTGYYETPQVAERIHGFFPEAKIVFLLRNPVDRALSNYFFSVQHGLETRSLADAFLIKVEAPKQTQFTSVNPFDYINRSKYSGYLADYNRFFKGNVITMISEELFTDKNVLNDFFEVLGVDHADVFENMKQKVNQSELPEGTSLEGIEDVRIALRKELSAEIGLIEEWLGRKIPSWE